MYFVRLNLHCPDNCAWTHVDAVHSTMAMQSALRLSQMPGLRLRQRGTRWRHLPRHQLRRSVAAVRVGLISRGAVRHRRVAPVRVRTVRHTVGWEVGCTPAAVPTAAAPTSEVPTSEVPAQAPVQVSVQMPVRAPVQVIPLTQGLGNEAQPAVLGVRLQLCGVNQRLRLRTTRRAQRLRYSRVPALEFRQLLGGSNLDRLHGRVRVEQHPARATLVRADPVGLPNLAREPVCAACYAGASAALAWFLSFDAAGGRRASATGDAAATSATASAHAAGRGSWLWLGLGIIVLVTLLTSSASGSYSAPTSELDSS
jgi:hypothetical protein